MTNIFELGWIEVPSPGTPYSIEIRPLGTDLLAVSWENLDRPVRRRVVIYGNDPNMQAHAWSFLITIERTWTPQRTAYVEAQNRAAAQIVREMSDRMKRNGDRPASLNDAVAIASLGLWKKSDLLAFLYPQSTCIGLRHKPGRGLVGHYQINCAPCIYNQIVQVVGWEDLDNRVFYAAVREEADLTESK